MAENKEEIKECQLCHQMLPMSSFYKRKDRNGEYNWTMSYCGKCDLEKVKQSKAKNPDYYREQNNEYKNNYYHQNKDRVRIVQKRYYYKKLSPEKQLIYKGMLQEKYPEWVKEICK
jgi:hypothetical protein